MAINEALKNYIEKRGFKQQTIANAIGLKKGTLNAILNGHCRLSADVFMKVCDFMKATPDDVLKVQ